MARINIEDKWWIDPRRSALIKALGEEERADGAAVKLWRLGQDYWKKDKGGIPKQCFDLLPYAQELIRCGLVVVRECSESFGDVRTTFEGRSESFVFVRGCSEHFDWMTKKREAASIAGKKSAESRKNKHGSAQPRFGKNKRVSEPPPNERSNTAEQRSNEINVAEPSSSSSLSSSLSSSSSTSTSKIKKKTNAGIRMDYPQDFDEAWKLYGSKGDKKAAYKEWQDLALDGQEKVDLITAIPNYQKVKSDRKFRKDFENFLRTDWRTWVNPTDDVLSNGNSSPNNQGWQSTKTVFEMELAELQRAKDGLGN